MEGNKINVAVDNLAWKLTYLMWRVIYLTWGWYCISWILLFSRSQIDIEISVEDKALEIWEDKVYLSLAWNLYTTHTIKELSEFHQCNFSSTIYKEYVELRCMHPDFSFRAVKFLLLYLSYFLNGYKISIFCQNLLRLLSNLNKLIWLREDIESGDLKLIWAW